MTHTLRHVTIARNDDLYEAFPDICLLPAGKLLCIRTKRAERIDAPLVWS